MHIQVERSGLPVIQVDPDRIMKVVRWNKMSLQLTFIDGSTELVSNETFERIHPELPWFDPTVEVTALDHTQTNDTSWNPGG